MESSTRIYGLVGHPLEHSLSPVMHNTAFRMLNIPGEYRLFQKEPEELDSFLMRMDKENIWGLNVTVPYKEKILDSSLIDPDKLGRYAKEIRAVNTIVRKEVGLNGFNTDIAGFLRHLNKLNFNPQGKKAAILGAGGAGKAVAYALAKKGVSQIAIFDINKGKAEALSTILAEVFSETHTSLRLTISAVEEIEQLDIINKDILINATPVGLNEDDPCLIDESLLHEGLFVYDLIYNPYPTKLLSVAKARGLDCADGLGMLVYQGAFSFFYFTETTVPCSKIVRIMWSALESEIGRR